MIEKQPGYPLISKLRALHLFESDFNLLVGILWGRRLLYHGENKGIINEAQYGSRPNKSTTEVLLFKHLTYGIWRMTKTDAASFDNDAKACYDRIVMLFGSLCSRHFGMPKPACEFLLTTMQQARYHIMTQQGMSDKSYGTTQEHQLHGPGQGSRCAPSLWVLISSLLMDCMTQKSDGMTIQDPAGNNRLSQIMTGFVDDTTHWINFFQESIDDGLTLDKLVRATKQTAQWWENLLYTSGGKLELMKCFYYLLVWTFDNEGEEHLLRFNPASPNTIKIRDSQEGEETNISIKQSDESHKTLGVYENPSGDYADEHRRLQQKGHQIAQLIATTSLTPQEAMIFYRSTYIPSMVYSALVGTINQKTAEKIQSAPTIATLWSLGYNAHMPRAVVFGPTKYGGIGLRHLFIEFGKIKVKTILQHLRGNTQSGQIIMIYLQWAQLVTGTDTGRTGNNTTTN